MNANHWLRATSAAAVLTGLAIMPSGLALAKDYFDVEAAHDTLLVRPGADETPIDDINWFARPVPNPEGHWIVGYAMHDQNYLYDLTSGKRVRIPDKSDAVATPDGKYMTVPSFYTPDGFVRFYDTSVLLDHLVIVAPQAGVEGRQQVAHGPRRTLDDDVEHRRGYLQQHRWLLFVRCPFTAGSRRTTQPSQR